MFYFPIFPIEKGLRGALAEMRKGIIDAVKKGKTWFTTKKTIDLYIKQHGRKVKKA
jgi:hypothetical protein